MRVLLSYGGTRVPIDDVRSITNFSGGTFGSKIAIEFLKQLDNVDVFRAKNSVNPFELRSVNTRVDLLERDINEYKNNIQLKDRYSEHIFDTYEEYDAFFTLGKHHDIIISCAAVSDFTVEKTEGKIKSKNPLSIDLKPVNKTLNKIRLANPEAYIVGFKLLSGTTNEELYNAAKSQLEYCDMVVANHLETVGKKIFVITKDFTDVFATNITERLVNKIKEHYNDDDRERNIAYNKRPI